MIQTYYDLDITRTYLRHGKYIPTRISLSLEITLYVLFVSQIPIGLQQEQLSASQRGTPRWGRAGSRRFTRSRAVTGAAPRSRGTRARARTRAGAHAKRTERATRSTLRGQRHSTSSHR